MSEIDNRLARKIGTVILESLQDRRGIGDAIDACDTDIQKEIALDIGRMALEQIALLKAKP